MSPTIRLLKRDEVQLFSNHIGANYRKTHPYHTHPGCIEHFYGRHDQNLNIYGFLFDDSLIAAWPFLPFSKDASQIAGATFVDSRGQKFPMAGLRTMIFGLQDLNNPIVITSGVGNQMKRYHERQGYQWRTMDHHFMPSINYQPFSKRVTSRTRLTLARDNALKQVPESDFIPNKDSNYYLNRYATHPFFSFLTLRAGQSASDDFMLILKMEHNKANNILRVYDYFGPKDLLVNAIKLAIVEARATGASYIDIVSLGLKKSLEELGFSDALMHGDKYNVTDHFYPYSKVLVKTNIVFKGVDERDIVLFKGYGDQVIPGNLNSQSEKATEFNPIPDQSQ